MIIGKLLNLNVRGMQLAFVAGAALGVGVGVGIGVGIGAAFGALYAPKKGSELRGDIKDKLLEATDVVKAKGAELADKACNAYSDFCDSNNVEDEIASA